MATAPLPLDGVRILDASRVLAGPFAAMLLADLGADVIKLEPPTGDESRGWGPPFWGDPADQLSAYFCAVNRNKRSVVIDLRTDAGRDLLDRLADQADLLVHNARPSSARRLGLDHPRLARLHPNLVVASISGFPGQAAAERPAYDLLAQAVSGLMAVTGEPDGAPMKAGAALLDLLAGLELAVGSLAALLGRARGSAPPVARVEVALVEAGVTGLVNVLANLIAGGSEPVRHGNAHPNIVPYQVFAAVDGHLALAVGNDAQFARLWNVLGLEPDPRFASNPGRIQHREEVVGRIAAAMAARHRDELVAELEAMDVPAGPVNQVSEALAAMEAAHPDGWLERSAGVRLAPDPIRLDAHHPPLRMPPPRLGEHTDAILQEAGLDAGTIADLRSAGVVR